MNKIVVLATAAALYLGACATGPSYTQQDAQSAIAAAKAETKQAKKVNYEWRDTGKMIKSAEAALKKEDFATAVKLANKAKKQSSNALMQFQENKNAGPLYDK